MHGLARVLPLYHQGSEKTESSAQRHSYHITIIGYSCFPYQQYLPANSNGAEEQSTLHNNGAKHCSETCTIPSNPLKSSPTWHQDHHPLVLKTKRSSSRLHNKQLVEPGFSPRLPDLKSRLDYHTL